MITNIDFTQQSFSKLLVLVLEAANVLGNIDSQHAERDKHKVASNLYNEVSNNDKTEFTITIGRYVERLNTVALSRPYDNQDILLLIEAINACTTEHHYYRNLNDMYPDIKHVYITDYYRHDYQSSTQNVIRESEPVEAPVKKDTNDFDFDDSNEFDFGDDAVSTSNTIGENVIRKPNRIDEEAAEIRAAAQAAAALIETQTGSEKKRVDEATTPEMKPCVKAFFWIAGVSVIAALIISWMY